MDTAFGTSWDAKTVSKLQQSWLKGNFGDLPQIKISGDLDVIGANGAYAIKTDTIYLSQGFVERNAGNIGGIKSVLLEEIGHSVDFRINFVDAAGDEGDIFQRIVQKQSLNAIDLSIMKAENDYATININSESLTIEMSRIEAIAFNNKLYQSIRGTDNGVYTRSTSDGNSWTGWVLSGYTINTPELEVFKNQLYQTVRGTDNGVYTRSTSDGNKWTNWVHSGGTLDTPELETFNGKLYQTVRGTDNGVYTRSTSDGNGWTNWERNGSGLDAPELEEFNGKLYQTVRGEDQGVYTRSTADGRNWTSWDRNGNGLDAPELEVFNNRLYQTIRGGDEGTYTRSTFDGINWTSWERNGVGLSSSNFTVFNNRFFQHVEGIDSKVYTRSLTNSPNATWTEWREFGGWTFKEGGSPQGLMATPDKLAQLLNGQLNGKSFNVDKAYGAQCWDLVAHATGNMKSTITWRMGVNVMANGNVAVGTAIATFLGPNNAYDNPIKNSKGETIYTQHTAIFAGYGTENGVRGFYVWDQSWNQSYLPWDKRFVQKHFIRADQSGTSDADNYHIIKA